MRYRWELPFVLSRRAKILLALLVVAVAVLISVSHDARSDLVTVSALVWSTIQRMLGRYLFGPRG